MSVVRSHAPHSSSIYGNMEGMHTPLELYRTLVTSGTTPALIWYGEISRIELSGKVCANHIAKIANFLSEECEVVPTTPVLLDLPAHWKTVLWSVSALVCGAHVRFIGNFSDDERRRTLRETGRDAVVVTSDPHRVAQDYDGDFLIALNLSDLALSWDGADLPTQVYDGAAEVLGYADALLVDADSGESNFRELMCESECSPDAHENSQHLMENILTSPNESAKAALISDPAAQHALYASYLSWEQQGTLVVVARQGADLATIAREEKAQILNF
ncbi:TIGR03089 family protein [Arcanobacterium bovis]|uniref:TIGR03089 family protein n=1 Tax=Arcanobacterium bovis TaxID=2529275 RepID=A0A4Q9V230_9ACTO|nr:TIGR03089 family protein [Arcanobacterium bovis]TBW23628.1 hypothetical protein EZJ44_00345 [Arcanobacterium bovis]